MRRGLSEDAESVNKVTQSSTLINISLKKHTNYDYFNFLLE